HSTIASCIYPTNKIALLSPTKTLSITYSSLDSFVDNFSLPLTSFEPNGILRKPIVAVAIPNGPVLAALCIAVANRYILAPINRDRAVGVEQFKADVLVSGATGLLVASEDLDRLQLGNQSSWAAENGIDVFVVKHHDDYDPLDTLTITPITEINSGTTPDLEGNKDDDIAILLFTSGTSGTKKIVPLTINNILSGVRFVVQSWELTADDVCLNMMPLFHSGGLIRNILAPLLSGGSVICCPAFDANMFWDIMEEGGDQGPTWYYASPSMHQMILELGKSRQDAVDKAATRIRLVCNAAGGLLPALAYQIRDCFLCTVLPSYGMTECMPISTPPAHTYRLERPGTSGVTVGPELNILGSTLERVPPGTVGHICVRGAPVFPGYLGPNGTLDTSVFTEDGWFDTGDMGYLDSDGYLYITGRSKEVINRGGEIISPFEVEQAIIAASQDPSSPIHDRVTQCLAFSVPHDVLQEVVGAVLVTPNGKPRVGLRQLQKALRSSLQQAKLPALVVFMDDLPRRNNKVLRIKLAERLGLPTLSEEASYTMLHWQAECPPPESGLSVSISSNMCKLNESDSTLDSLLRGLLSPVKANYAVLRNTVSGALEVYIAPSAHLPHSAEIEDFKNLAHDAIGMIKTQVSGVVHGYLAPEKYTVLTQPIPFSSNGSVERSSFLASVASQLEKEACPEDGEEGVEGRVKFVFARVLNISVMDIPRDQDFLALGGDSLRAGKLLSALRTEFRDISIPIELVFRDGSVAKVTEHVSRCYGSMSDSGSSEVAGSSTTTLTKTHNDISSNVTRPRIPANVGGNSSTSPLLLAVQLLPLCLMYPLRRSLQWTIFLITLANLKSSPTARDIAGRLLNIVVSLLFARVCLSILAPLFGIMFKWIMIGRHREGVYSMWGVYHTRWWLTQKIVVSICGTGAFGYFNWTKIWYYRLLGAKIGKNVEMNQSMLKGEWDLVEIGDNVVLADNVHIRPFAVEKGCTMYLGKITIGNNASVGLASILAPGTSVPEGGCIGANSSSWEQDQSWAADPMCAPYKSPRPHWLLDLFGTLPVLFLAKGVKAIPWVAGLLGMVMSHPLDTITPVISIIRWFSGAGRVGYHFLAVCLGAVFGPMFLFMVVLAVKATFSIILGKAPSGPAKNLSQISKWRMCLIKDMLPESALHELTSLFGQHYEMTSRIMRLLGAKVGKRVYWPGTGPRIGDYHLLDVGDDVVFGSRANLVTSDGVGSEMVTIKKKAMVADRVTLMPGAVVGENTVLGSGALTKRGKTYVDGGVYVGAKGGDAVCLSTGNPKSESEADSTPFGRAFYLGQAPYRVLGQLTIAAYCIAIKVIVTAYWNLPFIVSVQVLDHIHGSAHTFLGFTEDSLSPFFLCALFTLSFSILVTIQSVVALAVVIASKWILLGRRQPGNYSWDKSSYCQRWQIFLAIESLRRNCFRGQGILGMLTGTHYLAVYFRLLGADIGKDCALFANGDPSLMFTEPDLLKLGNRVAVDDASLVGHINSRGKFDLNSLRVGDGCVMRSGSRLLSGAVMEEGSCLMEHTLVMGGEVVEAGKTVQGWPGEVCSV
ncbi:hypothetical protein V8F20_011984, partial [Naviculisporaceae sp. PSN 640]